MEPNPHDPTLPLVDHQGPESPPLRSDVRELHERVVALDSALRGLSQIVSAQARSEGASGGRSSPVGQRFSAVVDREELVALADWVAFYQEQHGVGTLWLDACWWRHTVLVHELAALRGAWTAVYQSDEPVHGAAALQWHEAASRCRSRIREVMSAYDCIMSSHEPSRPSQRFWIEEARRLHRWVAEGGSDEERWGAVT